VNASNDPFDMKAKYTAEQYKDALKACRPLFAGTKYLELLRTNYYAPDHQLTAADMAEAVGYKKWNSANLQYGRLAGAVVGHLGLEPGTLVGVDVPVTPDVAVLVSFGGGGAKGENVTWRMLPGVIEALEGMKWVRSDG